MHGQEDCFTNETWKENTLYLENVGASHCCPLEFSVFAVIYYVHSTQICLLTGAATPTYTSLTGVSRFLRFLGRRTKRHAYRTSDKHHKHPHPPPQSPHFTHPHTYTGRRISQFQHHRRNENEGGLWPCSDASQRSGDSTKGKTEQGRSTQGMSEEFTTLRCCLPTEPLKYSTDMPRECPLLPPYGASDCTCRRNKSPPGLHVL